MGMWTEKFQCIGSNAAIKNAMKHSCFGVTDGYGDVNGSACVRDIYPVSQTATPLHYIYIQQLSKTKNRYAAATSRFVALQRYRFAITNHHYFI